MTETERDEFDSALQQATRAVGLTVEAADRDRMFGHYRLVVEANRQFNLTRITAPADAAVKHYADSLSLLATGWVEVQKSLRVLDVGTGAGFPAAPLAIACPAWTITAIDGTGKKVRFVENAAQGLGLANLHADHIRVEDLVRQSGHKFDLVLVRAVAKIADLLASLNSLIKSSGQIVFYKTGQVAAEIEAAVPVASKLMLAADMHHLELPAPTERLIRELVRYRRHR